MKKSTYLILKKYIEKHSFIRDLENNIVDVFNLIDESFRYNGKLLICGNGGSAADADHIVGELLKGFCKLRPLNNKEEYATFGAEGIALGNKLQESLPAINLSSHAALITAVMNDIGSEEIYAQQVVGYGNSNDVLIGISTSGNSPSIIYAHIVSKIKKMKTVALTGKNGGRMNELFDYVIKVPSDEVCDIQDMHSIVYHLLCAMLENERWEI